MAGAWPGVVTVEANHDPRPPVRGLLVQTRSFGDGRRARAASSPIGSVPAARPMAGGHDPSAHVPHFKSQPWAVHRAHFCHPSRCLQRASQCAPALSSKARPAPQKPTSPPTGPTVLSPDALVAVSVLHATLVVVGVGWCSGRVWRLAVPIL